MATAEAIVFPSFSKLAGILSAVLSQHHLLGFEIVKDQTHALFTGSTES